MTLPLELGGIQSPEIRRALEQLSQQFPIVATGGGGGAPSGPAGGVLGGTYPNPLFAADMATQAELDTHTTATTTAHGGIVASSDARLSDARTPTAHTHPAADVASGVLATARLGSGTPAASTYVDGGTGAWTALPAVGVSGVGMTTLDTWHVIGAAGEPAFQNAHSALAGFNAPAFRKNPFGEVELRGVVNGVGLSATIFTLPAGYRPATAVLFDSVANNAQGRINVDTAGNVNCSVGTAGQWVTLDGLVFDSGTVSSFPGWTAIPRQAADLTNATITLANTDLVFTFAANSTYLVDLYLLATSAATTTGYALAFDVSAAVTAVGLTFEHQLATTGTLTGGDSIADAAARALSSGVPTAAALTPILGKGILVSGANTGTCRLQFAPEVAASATFKAGSTMRVMRAA